MLFAISKTKELPANCNLRKIHQQFGQRIHRRTAHRQTAKRFCRTGFGWYSQEQCLHETMQEQLLGNRFSASGKRGFHPCFCLPACCNCPVALSEFVTSFIEIIKLRISKFQKMQLQQEKQTAKFNLLCKCGLLAHTSAAFLKNCCTEKLFRCLRFVFCNQLCFIWFLIRLHHNR